MSVAEIEPNELLLQRDNSRQQLETLTEDDLHRWYYEKGIEKTAEDWGEAIANNLVRNVEADTPDRFSSYFVICDQLHHADRTEAAVIHEIAHKAFLAKLGFTPEDIFKHAEIQSRLPEKERKLLSIDPSRVGGKENVKLRTNVQYYSDVSGDIVKPFAVQYGVEKPLALRTRARKLGKQLLRSVKSR